MTNPNQAPQLDVLPDQAQAEVDPGHRSSIMDWMRDTRPGQLLTDFAMGAAMVLPGAGGAAIALTEAQPAMAAGNVPANTAEASNLQQDCINDAVERRPIKRTQMRHAGVLGVESFYARIINKALPSYCDDIVLRREKFKFSVENPVHRARWDSLQPGFNMGPVGNDGGQDPVYSTADNSGRGLYKCSEGSKTTGARVTIRVIAQDPKTFDALAKGTYSAPIKKITPKPC